MSQVQKDQKESHVYCIIVISSQLTSIGNAVMDLEEQCMFYCYKIHYTLNYRTTRSHISI